jgi:2-methylfumaryl-CoA isomerase
MAEPLPPCPAPRLGEHTEQVLGELLGIGTGEFGRLLARRVVSAG